MTLKKVAIMSLDGNNLGNSQKICNQRIARYMENI
jgi:hypothetical protein